MSASSTCPNLLVGGCAAAIAVDASVCSGDHLSMSVPEETRVRLSRWCTARIPATERRGRQIGYTIQGDEVTIVDRRAPAFPELGTAWSTRPLAQLRGGDPEAGCWSLYRPAGADRWQRVATGHDPVELLEQVRD